MKFIETKLKGAYIIEPLLQRDPRGVFARMFCKKEFSEIGHKKEFVQFNHSLNLKKGTIRGLHFQKKPYTEIKLVRCISGSVFDVVVDLRKNSATFLKWCSIIISKENMLAVYIPEGFAHGFQTIEENSELIYHHTRYYNPSFGGRINPFDKTVGVKWPLDSFICSDADINSPEIFNNFKGI